MCGIAGILNTNGRAVLPDDVEAMTAALAHRGPDGSGVHVDGHVGLGHRRLSIIDLDGGVQPLSNEDESVWVTFNGEIYNYRELRKQLEGLGHTFRTASDTETLVHGYEQWGRDLPSRLRGMFAFAIWDGRNQRLFLARDRVGIKPLYYFQHAGKFAFASELQALRSIAGVSATLDPQAVDAFLHFQYIPAPSTIYREVKKLPPAHFLEVAADGNLSGPSRYWDLQFRPDRTLNVNQWTDRLNAALEETIRTHLVSDVPFGAFLSGGVDSSTVLAYMSQLLPQPVKAFCIGHPNEEYDERQYAREAARICGAEYLEEIVEPDGMALLPELVRHFGEPFGDSSAIPTFYASRLARRHVKMVLSGDGGDELFAGYHAYPAILWDHRPPVGRIRQARHALANRARAWGLWARLPQVADSKYARTAVIEPALRARLWRPKFASILHETRDQFDRAFSLGPQDDILSHLQYFDICNYVACDSLTKVDIASMYHGLEVRVPLLDHVFLETVAQIPIEFKLAPADAKTARGPHSIAPGEKIIGKYLLKRSAERFFPQSFLHREKRGFELPVREWFGGPHRDELHDRLLDPQGPLSDYFDRQSLSEIVESAACSRSNAWKAWLLVVLQEWFSQSTSASTPVQNPAQSTQRDSSIMARAVPV